LSLKFTSVGPFTSEVPPFPWRPWRGPPLPARFCVAFFYIGPFAIPYGALSPTWGPRSKILGWCAAAMVTIRWLSTTVRQYRQQHVTDCCRDEGRISTPLRPMADIIITSPSDTVFLLCVCVSSLSGTKKL